MDSPYLMMRKLQKQCFCKIAEKLSLPKKSFPKKASQATDVTVKSIKENKDLVSFYVFHNFNSALSSILTQDCP